MIYFIGSGFLSCPSKKLKEGMRKDMPTDSRRDQLLQDSQKIGTWGITKDSLKFKVGDIVTCLQETKFADDSTHELGQNIAVSSQNEAYFNNDCNSSRYEVTRLYCLEMYTNNGRDIEFAYVRAASKMEAIETAGFVVWNFHECTSCNEVTEMRKLELGSHNTVWGINLHKSDYGVSRNRVRDVKFRIMPTT
jgi:hypothetical protein